MMKRGVKILLIIIAISAVIVLMFYMNKKEVSNFEQCAAAGYPVMESYPRQCRASNGDLFVEEIE